jgi:hypothetical protein
VWRRPKTPDYGVSLAIGVVLGFIVFYKLVFLHRQVFGEGMMFLYYGYLVPLNLRIRRGFYNEGIWTDTGFVPYHEIGGITWREGEHQATLIVWRLRNLARSRRPARALCGGASIAAGQDPKHDIQFTGTA